jgi:hypothetical protein
VVHGDEHVIVNDEDFGPGKLFGYTMHAITLKLWLLVKNN